MRTQNMKVKECIIATAYHESDIFSDSNFHQFCYDNDKNIVLLHEGLGSTSLCHRYTNYMIVKSVNSVTYMNNLCTRNNKYRFSKINA